MEKHFDNTPTEKELRCNVLGQGVKILHALMEHYASGSMEDQKSNDLFIALIQLVCEGRVKGAYSDTGKVMWRLSDRGGSQKAINNLVPFPLTKGKE